MATCREWMSSLAGLPGERKKGRRKAKRKMASMMRRRRGEKLAGASVAGMRGRRKEGWDLAAEELGIVGGGGSVGDGDVSGGGEEVLGGGGGGEEEEETGADGVVRDGWVGEATRSLSVSSLICFCAS